MTPSALIDALARWQAQCVPWDEAGHPWPYGETARASSLLAALLALAAMRARADNRMDSVGGSGIPRDHRLYTFRYRNGKVEFACRGMTAEELPALLR